MAAPLDPLPLPFDPTGLDGLSDMLLRSHWARTREQIAALTKDSPPMIGAGLLERELTFRNSAQLHELYFGNLGGTGTPGGAVSSALSAAFGSTARFEELFRLACSGLYGGSGWVVLAYALDYGAAAGKYVDAFWRNVDWTVVDSRLSQARGAGRG